MNFKLLLWKLGLLKSNICPYCGAKLLEKGYLKDGFIQAYKCINKDCKFNRD